MSRILIIEDEPRIAAFVAKGLAAAGYTTHVESSGVIGAQLAILAVIPLLSVWLARSAPPPH